MSIIDLLTNNRNVFSSDGEPQISSWLDDEFDWTLSHANKHALWDMEYKLPFFEAGITESSSHSP